MLSMSGLPSALHPWDAAPQGRGYRGVKAKDFCLGMSPTGEYSLLLWEDYEMSTFTRFTLGGRGDFRVKGRADSFVRLVKVGTVLFGATSGQAATLYTLAPGAILLEVICDVTQAFNSGDSDSLTIGAGAEADALMGADDITETQVGTYRKDAWVIGGAEGTAITATLTKAGTAATKGKADIYARIVDRL